MNLPIKLSILALLLTASGAFARNVIILPGDDPGRAIDSARPGDVVIFEEGKHYIGKGGVVVRGKSGITILGERAQLLQRDTHEVIMSIADSDKIIVRDLYMAHDPEVTKELCLGGVLEIESSEDISVQNCNLEGCGAWAISASNVSGLNVKGGQAMHNSAGVFWIFDCKDVAITGVLVAKNYESKESTDPLPVLYASGTNGVVFSGNTVKDNGNRIFDQIAGSSKVVIENNQISGNEFEKTPRDPGSLLKAVSKTYDEGDYENAARMAMGILKMDPKCKDEISPEFFAISGSAMLARAREVERGKNSAAEAADLYRQSSFFNRALATALLTQQDDGLNFEELYGEILRDYAPLPGWVQWPE